MRMSSFAPVLVSAAALTGCFVLPDAKSPATGAVATGEPLAVVDDVKVWTTTEKEKVGETVYKDENGNKIGTGETYQEKTRVHSMKVWYPVQGVQQLPDEDFFRIAGEEQALAETLAMRANGKKWNKRGKITMVAGGIGFIAGFFVPNATGRTLVMSAGGLAVSGGWAMSYWGAKQMDPEHHAVDRSIAERAARQYNQQLVGVSATKSF
jgi:hypothetical protein